MGLRFGRLLVIAEDSTPIIRKDGVIESRWVCQCDCGKTRVYRSNSLHKNSTTSCGCKRSESRNTKNKSATDTSYNAMINRYRQTAKNRKIKFKLSRDQAIALFNGNCHYCGAMPSSRYNVFIPKSGVPRTKGKGQWIHQAWVVVNGIDRVNSSLDYSVDNTVSCCWQCNSAKSQSSVESFISWARRLINYQDKGSQ